MHVLDESARLDAMAHMTYDEDGVRELSGAGSLFERPDVVAPTPPRVELVWNEEQVRAVEQILDWRFNPDAPRYLKLTGPAGSGKTSVSRELRRHLSGTRTAWSAMTGKAALRLRDALGLSKVATFHSALYHVPREVDNVEEKRIDLEFDRVKRGDADDTLLAVDEASMVGPKMFADVERSPYSKVLFIGDPYQLSPVLSRQEEREIGSEDYSVFSDLGGPHLTKVMRSGGAVLRAATAVREQQRVPTESGEDGGSTYDYAEFQNQNDVVRAAVEAYLGDREGHVLITWRNETRNLVNAIVRHRLGHAGDLPDPGEPLVIRKNNHRQRLMNGDVVRVEHVDVEGPVLAGVTTRWIHVADDVGNRLIKMLVPADFSGSLPYVGLERWKAALKEARVREVTPVAFAYCLTAHLAQGSGYRRVSIAVPGDFRSGHFTKSTRLPDGTEMPWSMRFLYTAISRAVRRASLFLAR